MILDRGAKLGPYEILAPIGAGGMGEVYRAKDTKLKRDVALKVLPEAFAADPERMARFQREAEVLASLNHPNIAQIYGVEERALVMELVEGESPKGPMPFDEAWKIASQIAAGLEYAHEKGIVHRDLKPANVKVTPEGVVKLLDFGLAKAFTGPSAVSANPDNSPTLTLGATQLGVILGAAAYMAPEQAKGKVVDKRADIWAFGVVLYELLTGERTFHGDDAAETLAAVIHKQPDLRLVPEEARRLLGECLQKDPKLRLRDIGDARRLLEEGLAPLAAASRSRLGVGAVVTAGVLAVGAAVASFGWWRAIQPVDRPLMKFSAELAQGPNGTFRIDDLTLMHAQPGTFLALTPDGTRIAVQIRDADGKPRLATRRLDENRFTPLPGTENPTSPFFSPDGQWIAFFGDGKLRKIPVQGGAPVVLSSSENFPSGSWGDDNTIIAALNRQGGLSLVSSEGGAPVPITALKSGELMHRWPQVLPGSNAALFTAYTGGGSEDANIEIVSLKTRERKTLIHGGVMGRYMADSGGHGYLVYLHQNTLLATAFDPDRRTVTGNAQPILDDVGAIVTTSPGDFDVARTGTFVYISGRGEPERSIFWLDHTGKTEVLHPAPGFYSGMRFSPDGKRLVFAMGSDLANEDLWVQDLERNASVRLTSLPGASDSPAWSVDGKYVVFRVSNQPNSGIYWIRSDGAGQPQQLVKSSDMTLLPSSLSPDGKTLALQGGNPFTAMEVSTAPLEGGPNRLQLGRAVLFLRARGFPMPTFSPDGHWLAYASGETGRTEVYVQPFPGPGGKVAISTEGGGFPIWSLNGHELFFLGPNRRIMVADYVVKGDSFSPSQPRVWSPQQVLVKIGGGPFQSYALTPDGKRFAVMLYPDGSTERKNPLHLTFLLNFSDELRRKGLGKK